MAGAADGWEAFCDGLQALPQNPARGHPRAVYFRLKRAIDFMSHVRPLGARAHAFMHPYPKPFRHVRFRTEDGVQLAGWLAAQPEGGHSEWGLVIVPGIFASKDDSVHRSRAVRIARAWSVPVLAIDMRAFGESTGIGTAGWKEGLDVHAAARMLAAETGVQRVAVLAESMGGAAALNAMAKDAEAGGSLLSGGMLCFSAFVDVRDAVQYVSTQPPDDHPFASSWAGFRRLLRYKSRGGYERFDEYLDDAARVNGLAGLDELLERADPRARLHLLRQPVLLVHATDDPVVPVRHARRVERHAGGMDHIQALVVPWGGHTGFEAMDPWWFWEVTRLFLGRANGVELGNLSGHKPPPAPAAARDVPAFAGQ